MMRRWCAGVGSGVWFGEFGGLSWFGGMESRTFTAVVVVVGSGRFVGGHFCEVRKGGESM